MVRTDCFLHLVSQVKLGKCLLQANHGPTVWQKHFLDSFSSLTVGKQETKAVRSLHFIMKALILSSANSLVRRTWAPIIAPPMSQFCVPGKVVSF